MSDPRLTIVEWDVPYCTRTFGTSPCTAALSADTPRKCFNMFKSCADEDSYDAGTLTIRFVQGNTDIPTSGTVFPILNSVSEVETTVNIAGADPTMSALGRRATVKVSLGDMVYHDRFFDKYASERISGAAQFSSEGYSPEARGSLMTRLKARYPYYSGSELRVIVGTVSGGVFTASHTTNYIVTAFDTTTPGSATIEAKDILDVAAKGRALAPAASQGRLVYDIESEDADEEVELTPAGIGDLEYPASGWVAIGSEIAAFTRSSDILTLTERGAFGSDVGTHSALDTAQLCLRFDNETIDVVYNTLLTEYAPIDGVNIPLADWTAEADVWASLLRIDALIPAPTDVSTLIAELSILGASIWWEPESKEIGFRMNRPPGVNETVWNITDSDLYSISRTDYDDRRLTDLIVKSVQIDPTNGVSADNFTRLNLTQDGDAKDPRAYGDQRIKEIPIRWLNQGADNAVRVAAIRYLKRFATAPSIISAEVAASKYGGIGLTDVVMLTTDQNLDDDGLPAPTLWQVRAKKRLANGHIVLGLQRYFMDVGDRPAYFVANDAPDYDDATEDELDYALYWTTEGAPEFEPFTWI